jgi:hypothetical protein
MQSGTDEANAAKKTGFLGLNKTHRSVNGLLGPKLEFVLLPWRPLRPLREDLNRIVPVLAKSKAAQRPAR